MKIRMRSGLFFFLTPVLLWLFLLIVIPHLELLFMSLRGENELGEPIWTLINYTNFFHRRNILVYFCSYSHIRTAGDSPHFYRHFPGSLLYHESGSNQDERLPHHSSACSFLGQRTRSGLWLDDPVTRKRCHKSFPYPHWFDNPSGRDAL